MQEGIKNEYNFVKYFNNKKISDLPETGQDLLKSIYGNVDSEVKIKCWRSNYYEKADIKLKINNIVKGISIKTGQACSMHQENKYKFYKYLQKIGIEDPTIKKFDDFIVGKINNQKVDTKTYVKYMKKDIIEINQEINKLYAKISLISRFLFLGTENQSYSCEAIIYGTPYNFIWATKDEIFKYLIEKSQNSDEYVNVSTLNIKCYDRNLTNDPKRHEREKDIQVKWVTITSDLQKIIETRENIKNKIIIQQN